MKNIKDLKISSVIACYKDEESIPLMHKRLTDVFKKIGCDYEIIFVNDGSPDDSEKILENIFKELKDDSIIFITHKKSLLKKFDKVFNF